MLPFPKTKSSLTNQIAVEARRIGVAVLNVVEWSVITNITAPKQKEEYYFWYYKDRLSDQITN